MYACEVVMITTKWKPTVDIKKDKKKGSKAYNYRKSSNHERREQKRNKGATKKARKQLTK